MNQPFRLFFASEFNFIPFMTNLETTVHQVEALYASLTADLTVFQQQANYSCISGCSKCCQSPHIEATILELLPYAFHVYLNNCAEELYDKLAETNTPLCILYEPIKAMVRKGAFADYAFRPLVCRLFGYSFAKDKLGQPDLITCKEIKNHFPKEVKNIAEQAKNHLELPMANVYYTRLTEIDYHLSLKQYPINEAMRLAIELVLNHFHFTTPSAEVIKSAS